MAVFFGEMQARSTPGRMKVVVTVDRGNLRLVSGTTELGEWPMHKIRLEEYTDRSILMAAEDEELILFLDDHQKFVDEAARYVKKPGEGRRDPTHPAFRKEPSEPAPSLREELRDDLSREAAPIMGEIRHLVEQIPRGTPLYVALGVFLILFVFLPQVITIVTLVGGAVALLTGGLAYADQKFAVRLPDAFTPASLLGIGGVLLVVGILVTIVR